jgi:hypothetical protein
VTPVHATIVAVGMDRSAVRVSALQDVRVAELECKVTRLREAQETRQDELVGTR